jgi:hypothetical protein
MLNLLRADPLPWLLECDSPGARYLALRDVVGANEDDAELRAARRAAHREGPIAAVLAHMQPEGYWVKPGPGYSPKYRSTVWAMTLLAELGAWIEEDGRLATACDYVLDHTLTPGGQFTTAPSGSTIEPAGTGMGADGHGCDRRLKGAGTRNTGEWGGAESQPALLHWLQVGPTFAA